MKKKILLCNPSEKNILQNAGDRPYLGTAYIASYLRDRYSDKVDIKLFDGNHQNIAEYLDIIYHYKPDMVGIGFTTPLYKEARVLLTLGKDMFDKIFKHNITFVAGGPHASALPQQMLDIGFDYVIQGEGETGLEELLKLPSNSYNKIIQGTQINNLDDLPLPARDLLNMNNYNMQQAGKRTGTLISSRGCPYGCVYCGKQVFGRKVRLRSPENVLKEVDELQNKYGYESLYFLDDVFTIDKERASKIMNGLKERNIHYRITSRADLLDEKLLDKLKDTGCDVISIGIESGSDKILKKANKGMTRAQNENIIKYTHKIGLGTKGFFILGLPGETEKTANITIDFAKKLKWEYGLGTADFYILTPFPGTKIWDKPENYGINISDKNFGEYIQASKDRIKSKISTKNLSAQRLEELIEKAKKKLK